MIPATTPGLAAGVMSGLFGIGGGIVIVPALVFLLGFTQQKAQGTTLGLLIPPIGILAAWHYGPYYHGRHLHSHCVRIRMIC